MKVPKQRPLNMPLPRLKLKASREHTKTIDVTPIIHDALGAIGLDADSPAALRLAVQAMIFQNSSVLLPQTIEKIGALAPPLQEQLVGVIKDTQLQALRLQSERQAHEIQLERDAQAAFIQGERDREERDRLTLVGSQRYYGMALICAVVVAPVIFYIAPNMYGTFLAAILLVILIGGATAARIIAARLTLPFGTPHIPPIGEHVHSDYSKE
jgi:hypothetical protein